MKFHTLVHSLTEVMQILNDQKVPFANVLFYCKLDDELYVCNSIELRYSEEIDKHAFIITLNKH